MTQAATETRTEAPSLLLVTDLGEIPPLGDVVLYLTAVDELFRYAAGLALSMRSRPVQTYLSEQERAGLRLAGVQTLQLGSPLELVLTSLAQGAAPLGYAVGAMLIFERGVKLLMEWQKHRRELQEPSSPKDVAIEVVGQLTEASPEGSFVNDLSREPQPDSRAQYRAIESASIIARYPVVHIEVRNASREPE